MLFVGVGFENAKCIPSVCNAKTSTRSTRTPVPLEQRIDADTFLHRLEVNTREINEIEAYDQKSEPWLRARKGRLTASNYGAAAGHNKYQPPHGLVRQMLWHTFKGNKNTQWGVDHEAIAFEMYREFMLNDMKLQHQYAQTYQQSGHVFTPQQQQEWAEAMLYPSATPITFEVVETGLAIRPPRFWLGNSPDGLVHVTYSDGAKETGLLEIKCPASKKLYGNAHSPNGIPAYYMDQIQGTMGNLKLPWCDFVVWTPHKMSVVRVPFSNKYWTDSLLPALTDFYFNLYLPAAVKKANNELDDGKIE